MATASDVLRVARGELGYDRYKDSQAGTKYGRWYAQLTGSAYFGKSGVPYCAMFVSWVFSQAGATCAGVPGAYTPTMLNAARKAGKVINARSAQPGDVVYFNWDGGNVDHVGIVELNKGSYIQTIEGNTNNGKVMRRTRAWGVVAAVVRPNYSGGSSSTSGSTKPVASLLSVDGSVGPVTTRRWQQIMGTTVDGVISGQYRGSRRLHSAIKTIRYGKGGSNVIRAVQRVCGITQDGLLGPDTIKHIQARLGVTQDGSFGPATARALQRRLNSGRF